jgi:hypothetical protein
MIEFVVVVNILLRFSRSQLFFVWINILKINRNNIMSIFPVFIYMLTFVHRMVIKINLNLL